LSGLPKSSPAAFTAGIACSGVTRIACSDVIGLSSVILVLHVGKQLVDAEVRASQTTSGG
jgi:hypothetical protein